MANVASFKQEYLSQNWDHFKVSSRSRISVWIGLAAFIGWALSHLLPGKRPTYVSKTNQEADHRLGEIKPTGKSKQRKDRGGLLSLVVELLGAVAISLGQRSFKSWRSTLIASLHNQAHPKLSSSDLPGKITPKHSNSLSDHGSETLPAETESEKPYQKSILALFKNTASEWTQDKCPQLGAALAYFTVFSLAPLVLVLLAVFGVIFGGSDHARQKITEQLQYLIDPSGIKVIQDIAANASKPQAGIVATTIGVVLALFGASGVFGQLQGCVEHYLGCETKAWRRDHGFYSNALPVFCDGRRCLLPVTGLSHSRNCLKRIE
jgi:Virulence factor BrkB